MKFALLAVAIATAVAGCADSPRQNGAGPTTTAGKSQCFNYSDMRGHTFSPDHRSIYLNIADREVFQVGVDGTCLGGALSGDPLVIVRRGGGLSVCSPIDLDISVGGLDGFPPTPCIVNSIRRLTPAQVAALPPKVRP